MAWRSMEFTAKRESLHVNHSREFSGEKRELIATNSLIGRLAQIERNSHLIQIYPRRIRTQAIGL